MSKITTLIPTQAFEVIRDRIGEILADEILNQFNVITQNKELNAKVWVERFMKFDHAELPAVNVMLAKGLYSSQTAVQADGTYSYNIDVYQRSESDSEKDGDSRAITLLHRLLGVCRGILEHPEYMTLGFARPFIMSRHFKDIAIADPNPENLESIVMGRLTFEVKAPETYNIKGYPLIAGYETSVKLELTDKGFLYKSV
jgi:hypothetical protein